MALHYAETWFGSETLNWIVRMLVVFALLALFYVGWAWANGEL